MEVFLSTNSLERLHTTDAGEKRVPFAKNVNFGSSTKFSRASVVWRRWKSWRDLMELLMELSPPCLLSSDCWRDLMEVSSFRKKSGFSQGTRKLTSMPPLQELLERSYGAFDKTRRKWGDFDLRLLSLGWGENYMSLLEVF